MQLPRGIYFEYKPALGSEKIGLHAYLVFRDGEGGERVIRGGIPDVFGDETLEEIADFATSFVGGNISVQADIPLQESKDRYDIRKGESPETRHAKQLELGGRDPEQVWRELVDKVNEIGEAGVDYNAIGDVDIGMFDFNRTSQNRR